MGRCERRPSSWSGGSGLPARAPSSAWARVFHASGSPMPRSMSCHVSVRYSVSNTDERGSPCCSERARATPQRMSQRTPPKSKTMARRLIALRGAGGRLFRLLLHDVAGQRHPAALLEAVLDQHPVLGAGFAVTIEVGGGVVPVPLVPLVLGIEGARAERERERHDRCERDESNHGGMIPCGAMLETTIAGGVPEPTCLAPPRTLW